jgi:hypothetical protein
MGLRLISYRGRRNCVYRVSLGTTQGNRPLGRHGSRWKDNIKMDLQEVGCGVMDWIELAQDRDRCECGNETSVFHKMQGII